MSESTKTINVPLWELKEIANTLRMVANALDSSKRESCLDRNMKQTLEQAAIEAVEKHYGMDAYPLFR